MLLDVDECQLVLVDYQEKLMPAMRDGEQVVANALRLAQAARLLEVPIWATEQNPLKLGGNVPALAALADKTLHKMSFSAATPELLDTLRPPVRPAGGNARSLP